MNILFTNTHIASNIVNAKTTSIVHILAHPSNARYANANHINILPTSLISQNGLNSMIVDILENINNIKDIFVTISKVCAISMLISGKDGTTINFVNKNIVKNHIVDVPLANP
jgi:hypothetical protein